MVLVENSSQLTYCERQTVGLNKSRLLADTIFFLQTRKGVRVSVGQTDLGFILVLT
jgi:hypothetical protein